MTQEILFAFHSTGKMRSVAAKSVMVKRDLYCPLNWIPLEWDWFENLNARRNMNLEWKRVEWFLEQSIHPGSPMSCFN